MVVAFLLSLRAQKSNLVLLLLGKSLQHLNLSVVILTEFLEPEIHLLVLLDLAEKRLHVLLALLLLLVQTDHSGFESLELGLVLARLVLQFVLTALLQVLLLDQRVFEVELDLFELALHCGLRLAHCLVLLRDLLILASGCG